ncbi:MAG: hypothetical protein Q8S73_36715 [Deltaproteobacteria bacterium]|nr:hypothetical protein [Myxococcales bacterium]MDP3219702.1 hypothetical protein [Deltaproteobacteria bacterium]
MLTLRDTLVWTLVAQGRAPSGARVALYRTRTSARHELVVGREVVRGFGPGLSAEAREAFDAACVGARRAA